MLNTKNLLLEIYQISAKILSADILSSLVLLSFVGDSPFSFGTPASKYN